jgi:hypothetical protein
MDHRVMVRFFAFTELEARAIHIEVESVHDPEALALPTMKKWWRPFHQGRRDLSDDSRSGWPLTNDLAGQLELCLKKGRSVCARFFIATSRLERGRACESFKTSLASQNSIFTGCCMPY